MQPALGALHVIKTLVPLSARRLGSRVPAGAASPGQKTGHMEKQRPQPRQLAQHSDATSAFSPGKPRPEDPKSPAVMPPGGEVNGLAGELLGYAYQRCCQSH